MNTLLHRAHIRVRRSTLVVGALVVLAGCGSGEGSSADTTAPAAETTTTVVPARPCEPTPDAPWRGMAAITEDYLVRVWNKGTQDYTEYERIGDDPRSDTVMGDYNVVETIAVDPATCRVFVGTCCEPVSGITYYDVDQPVDKWGILYGHYPTISPDGSRIAYSGYEEVTIASLQDPQTAVATITQPGAEDATIYDMIWLTDDELVLLGFTSDGSYLWRATVSTATLSDPVLITDAVSLTKGEIWSVGLVGVDDGALVVRAPGEGGARLQRRALDTLGLDSDEPFTGKERTYRIVAGRVVSVLESGRLMAFPVGADDALAIGGPTDLYVWAG